MDMLIFLYLRFLKGKVITNMSLIRYLNIVKITLICPSMNDYLKISLFLILYLIYKFLRPAHPKEQT